MVMEILISPSFGIDMSSSEAYVRDSAQDKHAVQTSCLFPQSDDSALVGSGLGIHPNGESSDNSSSIGAPDDSEDEEDDASSKTDETRSSRALSSFDSLEESLPIKRGLSNYFSGKSKSFTNILSEVSSVKDLKKTENPLNKKRRVLIASKWSRKSSFYGWSNNPVSMPLLTLEEEQITDQSSSDEKETEEEKGSSKLIQSRRHRSFKSKSCFSLADLQERGQSQLE